MAYQYAGALLFGLAETWAKSQETGVFRWIFLAFLDSSHGPLCW